MMLRLINPVFKTACKRFAVVVPTIICHNWVTDALVIATTTEQPIDALEIATTIVKKVTAADAVIKAIETIAQ